MAEKGGKDQPLIMVRAVGIRCEQYAPALVSNEQDGNRFS